MKWKNSYRFRVILQVVLLWLCSVLFHFAPTAGNLYASTPSLLSSGEKSTRTESDVEIHLGALVYRCSSYYGEDMRNLRDLLEELPGFILTDGGGIEVDGIPVTKIKVDGLNYYFDNVETAAESIPAHLVSIVVVTERIPSIEEDSGVADMDDPEKTLNLLLYKESIGKLAAGIGVGVGFPFNEKFEGLYDNAELLSQKGIPTLSEWSRVDGYPFLHNLDGYLLKSDLDKIGSILVRSMSLDDSLAIRQRVAMNYTITKMKGFSFKASALYNSVESEEEDVNSTISFRDGASDLIAAELNNGFNKRRGVDLKAELSGVKRNFSFDITPHLAFGKNIRENYSTAGLFEAEIYRDNGSWQNGKMLNNSEYDSYSKVNDLYFDTELYMVWSELGNPDRKMVIDAILYTDNENGEEKNYSIIKDSDGAELSLNDYLYDTKGRERGYSLELTYAEPLSDRWSLGADLESVLSLFRSSRQAFRSGVASEGFLPTLSDRYNYNIKEGYLSADIKGRYFENSAKFTGKYKFRNIDIQAGVKVVNAYSKVVPMDGDAKGAACGGRNFLDWSPFASFRFAGEFGRALILNLSGESQAVSEEQLAPVPYITDPAFVRFGNISLMPEFSNGLNLYYNFNNRRNLNFIYVKLGLERVSRSIVDAIWFDSDGVEYSIPVNSSKAASEFSFNCSMRNLELDSSGELTLDFDLVTEFGRNYSYQAELESAPIDLAGLDYTSFMAQLWGNQDGDRFYSGASGFKESRATLGMVEWSMALGFERGNFSSEVTIGATRNIANYSIDKEANVNTWDYGAGLSLEYEFPRVVKLYTDFGYRNFDGYARGFGDDICDWNARASKRIGKFLVEIRAYDILGESINRQRTATATSVEDCYSRGVGRRILLSFSYDL